MARRNNHGVTWQTIHLEGALLLPDLRQIAKRSHPPEGEGVSDSCRVEDGRGNWSPYQMPVPFMMIQEASTTGQQRCVLADRRLYHKVHEQLSGWNSLKKTQTNE